MIKNAKVLRGLPGCGKSTKAREFGGCICSADDFFMRNGVYRFNEAQQPIAHQWCLKKFTEAIESGEPLVILDNTNIKHSYYAPYVKVAEKNGYEVEIIKIPLLSVQECFDRTVHGVPLEIIQMMSEEWED